MQVFNSQEFGQVRTAEIDKKIYFVASDVAKILGYAKPNNAINQHCKGTLKWSILTRGGQQSMNVITEGDVYRLIANSKLPGAEKFESWIFDEVLPHLRRTGGYVSNEDTFISTYLPFADEATKNIFRSMLQATRQQSFMIEGQQNELKYKDEIIIGLVDKVDLAEKRQILNRVVRHNGADYQERWRELYKQFEMKYHINLRQRKEAYNKTHKPKLKSYLEYVDLVMDKVPELYEIACKLYENDIKELTSELYEIAKG